MFWQTGMTPWQVMSEPLERRCFLIATALHKHKHARLDRGEETAEFETADDQLARVSAWASRHGGLEMEPGMLRG